MTVKIVNRFYSPKENEVCLDLYSRGKSDFEKSFSPFFLGPIEVFDGYCERFENLWQFAKLYPEHADTDGKPTKEYWAWRRKGYDDTYAHRFPMGRGAKPLCSWWNGQALDYVTARKKIYGPYYVDLVRTQNWKHWEGLKQTYELVKERGQVLVIRDPDGYDYLAKGLTLSQVLNDPLKKCGHSMFLAMMLTDDPALKELDNVSAMWDDYGK